MSKFQWGVLGGGQMGYAIIAGAINAGVLEGKNVIVGDPFRTKEKREKWLALGATCLTKNEGNGQKRDILIFNLFGLNDQ